MAKVCPSQFREPVDVQRVTETLRTDGGYDDTWAPLKTIWAMVKETSGTEPYEADRLEVVKVITFTTWYDSDITEQDRLSFEGDFLNITRIDNLERKDQFMVIYAEAGVRT